MADAGDDIDRLERAICVCQMLSKDLTNKIAIQRNEAFVRLLEISYFSIVYRYYDAELAAHCRPMIEFAASALDTSGLNETTVEITNNDGHPALKMGKAILELYLCLQEFNK